MSARVTQPAGRAPSDNSAAETTLSRTATASTSGAKEQPAASPLRRSRFPGRLALRPFRGLLPPVPRAPSAARAPQKASLADPFSAARRSDSRQRGRQRADADAQLAFGDVAKGPQRHRAPLPGEDAVRRRPPSAGQRQRTRRAARPPAPFSLQLRRLTASTAAGTPTRPGTGDSSTASRAASCRTRRTSWPRPTGRSTRSASARAPSTGSSSEPAADPSRRLYGSTAALSFG